MLQKCFRDGLIPLVLTLLLLFSYQNCSKVSWLEKAPTAPPAPAAAAESDSAK